MNSLVGKFKALEREIAEEKGDFILFALFMRDNSLPDHWDLVVCAPWIEEMGPQALAYFVSKIKPKLKKSEFMKLSQVAMVDPSDPRVRAINREFHVEHGAAEIHNRTFFDMDMDHGFIITSKRAVKRAA